MPNGGVYFSGNTGSESVSSGTEKAIVTSDILPVGNFSRISGQVIPPNPGVTFFLNVYRGSDLSGTQIYSEESATTSFAVVDSSPVSQYTVSVIESSNNGVYVGTVFVDQIN
jgi:hypothetical protein